MWLDVNTALSEVPVNCVPLIDDTDFKSREESVTYNQAGMDLVWNFITSAGAYTQTAVTPTMAGDYDWTNQNNAMYSIEIPASGGASINNDTEGYGWFTGFATGILPWAGPIIGFRAAGLNDLLTDAAYSATRGLVGTALPAAAADAAGGVPISDTGGLDLDAKLANTNEVTAARMGALTDWIDAGRLDAILDTIATDAARLTAARAAILTDWINGGRLDLLLDAIPTTVMRGTDGANTTTPPTVTAIQTEMEENGASLLDTIRDELANGTDGLSALKTLIDAVQTVVDAIPTTAMRGTDSAALASVCTEARLAELSAANIPTDLATIAGYIDAEIGTLLTRLSAARAGYLDNLSAGAAALASALATAQSDLDALTGTDGATLATAQANYAPAKANDNMNLADNAITSGKYDESTAFPVSQKASLAASTIIIGTVSNDVTPATTTVIYSDDITEATADHYNGRVILFTSGILLGQATDITDYALVSGEGEFTITALTEPPGDNDTFVIV